jgi:lipid A ethanolaminephosphotransferase
MKRLRDVGAPDGGARPGPGAWRPSSLILLVSCWLALVGNLPLWRTVWPLPELAGWRGGLFAVGIFVWIVAALLMLLSLLAWKRVLKPVLLLMLLIAAASSYFMMQYAVVIDATMMANVANTDAREVRDLLSWPLLYNIVVIAVLPGWWLLRQKIVLRRWWPQTLRNLGGAVAGLMVVMMVTLLSFQDLASLMRNHKQVRYLVNPINTLYATGKLAADWLPQASRVLQPIGLDAALGPTYVGAQRTPLVVLVVGETARAANFSLGGYARKTNPELEQLAADGTALTYYSEVRSCGTNTQASLPCMFSHLEKPEHEASRQPHENLLDVLQRAGLAVLWIDNQSGCKGLCDRVAHVDTFGQKTPGLCADGECFDEVLLVDLDQRIAALDPARRARGVVLVLHQMGSHGPAYYRRSPPAFKKFMPECASNVLKDCPREELVNAYDNTLAYTDHVLAGVVHWLAEKAATGAHDTAMVYVSDHGESLGENNLYLHGLPYALAPDTQTRVPMLSWVSEPMATRLNLRPACLRQNAAEPLTHDNLFHAMLGLLDVQTGLYQRELDWFAACR